jgi:hypothetical protein
VVIGATLIIGPVLLQPDDLRGALDFENVQVTLYCEPHDHSRTDKKYYEKSANCSQAGASSSGNFSNVHLSPFQRFLLRCCP